MDPLTLLLAASVFTLIGVIAGIATGLIPGLHVNNVALAAIALQGSLISLAMLLFGWADPTLEELLLIVSTLIIGNVVTHTFLDFIPSVFLGAPEGDTALSVLPGHRMLLKGLGYEAVKLSAFGSLMSVFLALLMIFPLRLVMGSPIFAYEKLQGVIFYILLIVVMMLVLTERGEKRTSRLSRPFLSCHVPDGLGRPDDDVEGLGHIDSVEIGKLRECLQQAVVVDGVVSSQKSPEGFVRDLLRRDRRLVHQGYKHCGDPEQSREQREEHHHAAVHDQLRDGIPVVLCESRSAQDDESESAGKQEDPRCETFGDQVT